MRLFHWLGVWAFVAVMGVGPAWAEDDPDEPQGVGDHGEPTEQGREPEPEPGNEPEQGHEPEPEPNNEPEQGHEPEPEPGNEPEQGNEPEPELGNEPEPEPSNEPELGNEPEPSVPTEIAPAQPNPGEPKVIHASSKPVFTDEMKALIPEAILNELPPGLLRFLTVDDYKRFRATCAADLADEALTTCLTADASLEVLGTLFVRSVFRDMLNSFDAEMPRRLTDEDIDDLVGACANTVEPWADCTLSAGPDGAECADQEDALAACVAADEDVNTIYLQLQNDKKAAWNNIEQYPHLVGLLSVMTVDEVATLRKGCDQNDIEKMFDCLAEHELTKDAIKEVVENVDELVNAIAASMSGSGSPLTEEVKDTWRMRLILLMLTFPERAVSSIATECQKKPELQSIDKPEDFDAFLDCIDKGAEVDPIANPIYVKLDLLKGWLAQGRVKVEAAVRAKEEAAQDRSFKLILLVLAGAGGLGVVVVLLMPIFVKRKYPDAKGLWGSSAVAAGVLVLSLAVLGGALLVMRTVQGKVSTDTTSPKMRIADAAFSVLESDKYTKIFEQLSRERLDLAKTPLRELARATDAEDDAQDDQAVVAVLGLHWAWLMEQPEITQLAKNAVMLKEQAGVYKSMIGFVKGLDGLMGYVPIVLALVAVLLYLLPLRQTLVQIATAPARAARGEAADSKGSLKVVVNELKALGPYLLIVLALLPLTGLFIALAVEPVMEVVINVVLTDFRYLVWNEASAFAVQASIIGAMLLLVITVATYILAVVFFAGTFRKIMRARFQEGKALSEYKRFWIFGTLGLLFVLAFPTLYALLVRYFQRKVTDDLVADEILAWQVWVVPVAAFVGYLVVFWAARGLKAIKEMKSFPKSA